MFTLLLLAAGFGYAMMGSGKKKPDSSSPRPGSVPTEDDLCGHIAEIMAPIWGPLTDEAKADVVASCHEMFKKARDLDEASYATLANCIMAAKTVEELAACNPLQGSSEHPKLMMPAWAPGPGGAGRVYGSPSIDVPASIWNSNRIVMGADCSWIVEGDRFLPADGSFIVASPSLATALLDGSAWSYVAFLLDSKKLSPEAAALWLVADVANLWAGDPHLPDASACASGSAYAGSPVDRWREDTVSRIKAWQAKRASGLPKVTFTGTSSSPSKPALFHYGKSA